MKKAFITGITGQDGSYLAELLLEKKYEVYGMVRRKSSENFHNIIHIVKKLNLVSGDLTDQSSLDELIKTIQPDEIYNLAAQSFVPTSFSQPILTAEINALGVLRLLEAIRKYKPDAKFYQASSSETFGKVREIPQKETTPFYPRSPYGVSKTYAHYITVNYRESYGIFACSGICFNHESPRRGLEFVTRKITHTLTKIMAGKEKVLRLGNLDSKRDWGFAGDFVEAMWLMLQQKEADDYVIATGETHTIREFVKTALSYLGVEINWQGEGVECKGLVSFIGENKYSNGHLKINDVIIEVSSEFYRPAEVGILLGDPSKAKDKLGWQPKTNFNDLVKMMVDSDINSLLFI